MKRIVLKFGSGILTRTDSVEPDPVQLRKLIEAVALLKREGHSCVVVSSGAVASGLRTMGFSERPTDMVTLQACAAVGQTHLMHAYENLLRDHGLHVAQLLLTHADLETPARAENVKNTLLRLLENQSVVPIINENDSVATEELKLGDNDQLSSRVALLWGADVLMLLTSVSGLLKDMKRPQDGPIPIVNDVATVLHHAEVERSKLGTGGMVSKLSAVQAAVSGGVECIIASGRQAEQIPVIIAGQGECTRFPVQK